MRKKIDIIFGLFVVLTLTLTRKLPLAPNVSLLPSAFLFSGYLMTRSKWSALIPFAALFFSDFLLGFHSTMPWVYSSFGLTIWMGSRLKRNSVTKIAMGSLASSFAFFAITNFGVWLQSGFYPLTTSGFLNCYTLALPFFRNSLLSDLLCSFAIFQVYFVGTKLLQPLMVRENAKTF